MYPHIYWNFSRNDSLIENIFALYVMSSATNTLLRFPSLLQNLLTELCIGHLLIRRYHHLQHYLIWHLIRLYSHHLFIPLLTKFCYLAKWIYFFSLCHSHITQSRFHPECIVPWILNSVWPREFKVCYCLPQVKYIFAMTSLPSSSLL